MTTKEQIREDLRDFCFDCSEDFANNILYAGDGWKDYIIDTLKRANKKQLLEYLEKAKIDYEFNEWKKIQDLEVAQ
jgi:hypothetical protein